MAGEVTDLTAGQKYTDAFWKVVPIPAMVVGAAIAVSRRPSTPAIVALVMLGLVGTAAEALVCARLRAKWRRGVTADSRGDFLERHRVVDGAIALALLLGAFVFKASTIEGKTADKVIAVAICVALFGTLIAVDLFRERR